MASNFVSESERKLLVLARSLLNLVNDRPYDYESVSKLAAAFYELKDYGNASKYIERLKESIDPSGELYVKLARCYVRKYRKDQSNEGKFPF